MRHTEALGMTPECGQLCPKKYANALQLGERMKRNIIFVIVLCLALVFGNISQSSALLEGDLDKAKAYINSNMIPQAIEILDKKINKTPNDSEANFLLGTCYLMQERYSLAQEQFNRAVSLKSDYQGAIGKEYKKTANDAFLNGKLSTAGNLFDHAVTYDPRIKKEAYNFFIKLGDAKADLSAIPYYDKALRYTNDKDRQHQIGYRFLKIAINLPSGSQCKKLKGRAVALLGQEKVDEVFPRSFKETIFEQTFTDAHIDPIRGNIVAFTWNNKIRPGDYVEISGHIPEGKPEIAIYLGENFKPEWKSTENGYLSYTIEKVPPAGSYYLVRIEKDVTFTIKVSRKIIPGPNENLLGTLIQ